MIKNYLKIALRNLAKQKGLSAISVFGLAIGIACFSLSLLYALNEFSFDGFHKNAKNIYRVFSREGAATVGFPAMPMPLGPALKQDLPDVEDYSRYIAHYTAFVKTDQKEEKGFVAMADPSFFSMFSFPLQYGNPATALEGSQSLVLTEETARRLFGTIDVIGKTLQLKIGDRFDWFMVTAIAKNPPSNSSFQFQMLANFNYFVTNTPEGKSDAGNWGMNSFITYVRLKEGSHLPQAQTTLENIYAKYFPKSRENQGAARSPEHTPSFGLQPLTQIHTDPRFMSFGFAAVDPQSIWILLAISAGVLLIACINFTTLAIGRSAGRAKEVGVRKVIGGNQKSLIVQFLMESVLLAVIAGLAGFLLANLFLPFFREISGRDLSFSFRQFPGLFALLGLLIGVVGVLSGSYPAFLLSRFKAIEVLKSKIKVGGGSLFTKSLVTIQFALSAGLIMGTFVILRQLHYMETKDPGYNKDNLVVIKALGVPNTQKVYAHLKQELAAYPGIVGTASADNGFGDHEGLNMQQFNHEGKFITSTNYTVDPDYLSLMGMRLLAGRNFRRDIPSDTVRSVIINETMMNELGWRLDSAVDRPLTGYFGGSSDPIVIGVVKDFHYMGVQQKIEPALFNEFQPRDTSSFEAFAPQHFFIKLAPGNPSKGLAEIERVWRQIAPDYPLQYNFLDEDLDRFYKAESRLGSIVGWAGGISVFLACLGLFGLATLAAINRTKEIGIRKVLGASITHIVHLLSKDFIRLVVIAFVLATPVAWWLMNKWLQSFAYRIPIGGWVFVLTGLSIVGIALLTVSFQAIKGALTNPVKNLRTE